MSDETYAQIWAERINETYGSDVEPENFLGVDDLLDGESDDDAERRILMKAARCLRNGVPATFTTGELELVRHVMPAHEVHQSMAVVWVRDKYGPDPSES